MWRAEPDLATSVKCGDTHHTAIKLRSRCGTTTVASLKFNLVLSGLAWKLK